MENPAVVKVVSELGFDGLETTENEVVNVLVFDANKITIIDNGPWKQIGSSTIKKDFEKLFRDQLFTKHKKRREAEVPDELSQHKLEDVFAIKLLKNGKLIDTLDYSFIFNNRGEINDEFLNEMLSNSNIDVGEYEAVYNGKTYKSEKELADALKKDYGQ
jgi:hypothetical protein